MDKFWYFFGSLSPWGRVGLAFVLGALILVILVTLLG
jgi:hypothetical protein